MSKLPLFASLFFAFSFIVFGQVPQPAPTPPGVTDDDDVVKITTDLVQLDAVVTDKNGNQIKDLGIADFEVLQDGKPQKITNFSYVNTESPAQSSSVTTVKKGKNVILPPPVRMRPENIGRIVTFIVDDGNCATSQIGMIRTQTALKKFVGEQMLVNDVVAIYQTRGGSSLLQQYTADKNQLLRVIEKLRWFPPRGSCAGGSGDIFDPARVDLSPKPPTGQGNPTSTADLNQRNAENTRDNQTVGTVGVLSYVVRGLAKVSGRKVVFLMSDGLPVRDREGSSLGALSALRDLTDLANRASVVFNTIDVRGVFDASEISASDDIEVTVEPNSANPTGTDKVRGDRATDVRNSQDGLFFLADETGGNFYKSSNTLDGLVKRALNLEKGYYLIGYEPEGETFKGKNFNKIEIKLKRAELRVQSRTGFLGKVDEKPVVKKRTEESDLYDAIISPLAKPGLNIQLTAFFGNTETEGNFVRSLVYLDGNEITFVDEPNGLKKATLDVVAVTLNEKNEVVDEFNRTHIFKIEASALPFIKKTGLIYTTDVQVKKAGNYNFRLALRDSKSRVIGVASQLIEVPDLKKSKLFMSGLTISAVDEKGKFVSPSAVKPENAISLTATTSVPAIRRFRPDMIVSYGYTLYNAQSDKTTGQPKVSIQVNLYHNGKIISEGKPETITLDKSADPNRINNYGYLRLNAGTEKGDYVLQVIVKDLLGNETTSQFIDFEITQ